MKVWIIIKRKFDTMISWIAVISYKIYFLKDFSFLFMLQMNLEQLITKFTIAYLSKCHCSFRIFQNFCFEKIAFNSFVCSMETLLRMSRNMASAQLLPEKRWRHDDVIMRIEYEIRTWSPFNQTISSSESISVVVTSSPGLDVAFNFFKSNITLSISFTQRR